MATVSVIVPVYNGEKYLRECLDSLTVQTQQPYEILLIDDGSTDQTAAIADAYAARHSCLRVIHTPNRGVSAARNTGIQESRGEYLAFVDADDTVAPDWLETLSPEQSAPDIAICGFTRNPADKLGHSHSASPIALTENDLLKLTEKTLYKEDSIFPEINCNTVWAKLYRAQMIKENGILFPLGVKIAEDKVFNFQAFHAAKSALLIKETLYYCRTHADSVTFSKMTGCFGGIQIAFGQLESCIASTSMQAHFLNRLALSIVPELKNCMTLDYCHKDNRLPYAQRKAAYLADLHSDFTKKWLAKCDYSKLRPYDRFFYKLLGKPFLWIELITKNRLIRAAALTLTQPMMRR